ncbi:MAG: ATP-binding protein [Bacteroidales bacterium]|nr:ATP-binding protein [Alphaproteobacteria bacterium]MBR6178483.1 ATP-binding protein [Bacteroidales bacterium]
MFKRDLHQIILDRCFKNKAIILLGARQVGKTTLLKHITNNLRDDVLYLNCDEPQTVVALTNRNIKELKMLIGSNRVMIIDEAQKVDNIGLTIKIVVDNFPDVQVIATGSSAFELRNRLNEPLTGRKFEYLMFPISTGEIYKSEGYINVQNLLETRLIYGSYPDILSNVGNSQELLRTLADSYLYKDILASDNLRRPEILDRLLKALAFQIGSEVSYNEIAQTIGSDAKTVERYIDLLEKCFIIFRLNGLSRNLRNELKKSKKVFFYDNGIRNAVIQQFAPVQMRNDMGALWENFFISERIKRNHYLQNYCNTYFWRTKTQQEIDYIEESDGEMTIFEMKWNAKKGRTPFPDAFLQSYPVKDSVVVTPENYFDYLL